MKGHVIGWLSYEKNLDSILKRNYNMERVPGYDKACL